MRIGVCLGLVILVAGCSKPAEKRAPEKAPTVVAKAPSPPKAPDTKQLEAKLTAAPWQGVAGGKPVLLLFQPFKGALYAAMILGKQEMTCTVSLGGDGQIAINTQGRPTAGGLAFTTLSGKLSTDARQMKGTIELRVKQGFIEQASGGGDWELKQGDAALELEFYKVSCEGENPRGCYNLAVQYLNGRGVAKDEKKGLELTRKACTNGLQHACGALGSMIYKGQGTRKNAKQGRSVLKKACDAGAPNGCNSLAWYLAEQGKELDEALSLSQRAVQLEPSAGYIDTLAYVHLKRKEYDLAEQEALRALKLDPTVEEHKKRLADIRAAKGK